MKNFDLSNAYARINEFSVNVSDHVMLTPSLAKVVISYTGAIPEQEDFRLAIAKLFKSSASPIAGSFRQIDKLGTKKALIGFLRATTEVRDLEEAKTKGKYRAVASNLLMDETDKSLWEIKTGSGGNQYISRNGNDSFNELVGLATAKMIGCPTIKQVAFVPTMPKEFVAYVCAEAEEMMYGYVVASTENGLEVLPVGEDDTVIVPEDKLVEVLNLDGEDEEVLGPMAATAGVDKNAMIEYYRQAYGHAPDYLSKIIDQINQHAVA